MAAKTILGIFSIMGLFTTLGFGLTTTQTQDHISYLAADFPRDAWINNGYEIIINRPDTYKIGIHLPDGATITEMKFNWIDGSADKNCTLYLTRSQLNVYASYVTEASAATSGSSMTMNSTIVPLSLQIDNQSNGYYLELYCPPGTYNFPFTVNIYGITFEYTYPAYLALLKKP